MALKKIFKAVATVTVFSVVTRALSFVFKIYLSRTLGAEVMGLYQICLSVFFLFSALSSSGLSTVLSRKTAEARALDDKNNGFSLLSATLIIGVVVSGVTLLILYLLKPWLGYIISDSRAVPLFLIMAPALLSSTVYVIIRGYFWGKKEFTAFSVTETVEEVLRILFTLFFVSGIVSGVSGAYGIAIAFTVSDITVAVILLVMFFVKGGKFKKPTALKDIMRPALPLTAVRVFNSLVGTLLALLLPSRLIVGGATIAEATASFGRIAGMANPLLFAPNAIISSVAIVLIPEMSESGIKKNYASLNRHIDAGLKFSIIVSGLFMAYFVALGTELTDLLYKDVATGEYLRVAASLMLLMPVSMILTSALNSIGMEKETFYGFILSAVFMIAAVYILPPYIGIYSIVVANALSLLTSTLCSLYFLRKRTGYSMGFLKPFLAVFIFVIPCSFFARTLFDLTANLSVFFAMLLAGIGATFMYAVLTSVSGLMDIGGFIKTGFIKLKAPRNRAAKGQV